MDKYGIITVTLSTSVSIISLLTSILTVYINNANQRKIKILDIVYEKKYDTYKKFFELHANYYITKKYDEAEMTKTIMECLAIANQESRHYLKILLQNINGSKTEQEKMPYLLSDSFHNSVETLRKELDLK